MVNQGPRVGTPVDRTADPGDISLQEIGSAKSLSATNREADGMAGGFSGRIESDEVEIVELFLEELRAGASVDVEGFCRRYSNSSDELRSLLAAAAWMEGNRPFVRNGSADENCSESVATPLRLGEFQIVREIGRGAMGIVYEAIQSPLERRVALKILAPRDRPAPILIERFRREAQIASQLHHTHIVPVHGAGESDGHLFYAMQFIDGQSLLDWRRSGHSRQDTARPIGAPTEPDAAPWDGISNREPYPDSMVTTGPKAQPPDDPGIREIVPVHEIARIGMEIAQALQHAHTQRILHRDIKPSNILIDQQGRSWITDFGLAKPTESPDLTGSGDLVGTLRYMAPERFHGRCDARSDIYGLGATLYEALLGRPVIAGNDAARIIAELSQGREVQISANETSIPRDLRTIVNKAIRAAPEDRYESAGALADDLACFLEDRPITARHVSVPRRMILWSRRNPWLAAVSTSLVAVVVLGVLGLALLWQRAESLRDQAESNLQESQTNLRLAITAVDQFCDKVSADSRLLEHDLRPLRQQLLKTAVDFHQQLLDRRRQSRGSRIDLARAYARLGRLSSEIDSRDQTRNYLRQGAEAFEALLREEPRNAAIRLESAEVTGDLASLLDSTGEAPEAERLYHRALDLMGEDPDSTVRMKRANLLGRLGEFYRRHRRANEAEAPLRESLAICEELHQLDPKNDLHRAELAKALVELAEWVQVDDLRQWRVAEGMYLRAKTIHAPLVQVEKPRAGDRVTAARIQFQLARIYRLSGREADAVPAFQESIAGLRKLVDEHPSVASHHAGLASTLDALGELYIDGDQDDLAKLAWDESGAIWRRLTAMDPSNREYLAFVGEAEMNAGELAVHAGQWEQALQGFTEATKILRGVLHDAPNQSRAQFLLMSSLERRARLLEGQQRFEEASQDWEESIHFAEAVMKPWCQAQAAICAVQGGDYVRAMDLAAELASGPTTKGHGQSRFDAARALALASQAARHDSAKGTSERESFADRSAHQAVGILEELLSSSTKSRDDLRATKEFEALRDYPPFQRLLEPGE